MKVRGRLFATGTVVLGILVLAAAVGSSAALREKITDLYQSWRLGSKPVVLFYDVGEFTYGANPLPQGIGSEAAYSFEVSMSPVRRPAVGRFSPMTSLCC